MEAYRTKDGSLVREFMHPNLYGNSSDAETVLPVGQTTSLHNKHQKSEEIYHITSGSGMMELGGREFLVQSGDTVCIDPNTEHSITNDGSSELKYLAISSSPYQHSEK